MASSLTPTPQGCTRPRLGANQGVSRQPSNFLLVGLVTRSLRIRGDSECVGRRSSLGVETAGFLMLKEQLSPFAKMPQR